MASHVRLYQLYEQRPSPKLAFAVGWSDGFDVAPTVAAAPAAPDFVLPQTRTWYMFEGYISVYPFSFEQNSVVSSAITIRRSGKGTWIQKTP